MPRTVKTLASLAALALDIVLVPDGRAQEFLRGDVNLDGTVGIADGYSTLRGSSRGRRCRAAATATASTTPAA